MVALAATVLSVAPIAANPVPGTSAGPSSLAEFLPAPNPSPYCAGAEYFGPIDGHAELVANPTSFDIDPTFDADGDGNPANDSGTQRIGQLTASTASGISLVATTTAQALDGGTPRIHAVGTNISNGVTTGTGAEMNVTLSQPLFYSQWVFTDVDLSAEGFEVTPNWNAAPGQFAAFGGDANFAFTPSDAGFEPSGPGSSNVLVDFNDTNAVNQRGSDLETRVQVDFLGAVNGLDFLKTGRGNAGFTVGGGCAPLGIAKTASAPVYDPATGAYTVAYTINVNNNLPDDATLAAAVAAAQSTAASSFISGVPTSIADTDLQVVDPLDTTGFSAVNVISIGSANGLTVNPAYDGQSDTNLLSGSDVIAAGVTGTIDLVVEYVPDLGPLWHDCTHDVLNQAEAFANADGVATSDLSDDGLDASPASDNGVGTTDDPTLITFTDLPCEISLAKDISAAPVANGDGSYTLEYTLVAENTGVVPLSNVAINDDLATAFASAAAFTPTLVSDTCAGATLASAATCSQVISVTFTPAPGALGPFDNSAVVTAETPGGVPVSDISQVGADADPDGDGDPSNNSEPTSFSLPAEPSLDLVKSADVATVGAVGDPVIFSFVVTNDGNVPLDPVSVNDPLVGSVTCTPTVLDPGQVANCVADTPYLTTQADIDAGGFSNTATAEGGLDPAFGLPPVSSDPDTADIVADLVPSLALTKAADVATVGAVGDPVIFSFTVENDGNVTLDPVAVIDPLVGPVTCTPTALAPTQIANCVADNPYLTTQADLDAGGFTNTATAEGTPPAGSGLPPVASDPASASVVTDPLPAIELVKATTTAAFSAVGEVVPFTFDVTNTGNVTLDPISVTDPLIPGIVCPTGPLAPTATATCTGDYIVTQADLDAGEFTNSASATGEPPAGLGAPAPVADDTVVTPANPAVGIDLVKAAADPTVALTAPGQIVSFTFTVTNTGNVTLDPVSVTDPLIPGVVCPAGPLAPLASAVCTGDYIVTQADVDAGEFTNTATATGEPPAGLGLTPPVAGDTVVTPALVIESDSSLGNTPGSDVTIDPLANDPNAANLDPTTVMLIDPATGLPVTNLVVPGEGEWVVDPVTGAITFIPEPGFIGDPTPVQYQVADLDGNVAEPVDVIVTYLPLLEPDESLDNVHGSTVTIDVLGNDPSGAILDPASVMILDPSGNPVTSLVVPGEGEWVVDPVTGAISFIPEPGFIGDPTPITYQAADFDGDLAEPVEVVVTYLDPTEIPDDENLNNPVGSDVTVDVLANDGDVDPDTVYLIDPATGQPTKSLVVPGEGTWVVNPDGSITFMPEDGFLGDPTPVDYQVATVLGEVLTATAVVTYLDAPPVLAFTGLESRELLLAALLALAAGAGFIRLVSNPIAARKED